MSHKKFSSEKARANNQAWLDNQRRERSEAAARVRARRQPIDGLIPVRVPTLVEELAILEARGARFIQKQPGHVVAPPAFTPSVVSTHKEKEVEFISSQRVKPTKLGTPGKKGYHARLKVPSDIIEAVGESKLLAIQFEVELNDEGILFRPAGARTVQLPAWAAGSTERFAKAVGR